MRLSHLTITLFALTIGVAGCVTSSKRSAKSKKSKRGANAITLSEVTEGEPMPLPPAPVAPAAPEAPVTGSSTPVTQVVKTAPAITPKAVQSCQAAVARLVPPHQKLFALLPQGSVAPDSPLLPLLAITPAHCEDPKLRTAALKTLNVAISQHSGRIGVILPLTGPRAKLSAFILNGMRAALQESGLNFEQTVVLKDSTGVPAVAEARFAELVFKERPALVVGGLDQVEAELLARRGGELLMPTIIMSRDSSLTGPSTSVFNVYPDAHRLAETLAEGALRRGLRRVAVLRPAGGKSDRMTEDFRTALERSGAKVVQDLIYQPGNFDSMQGVARQLFKTNSADRADEYREAHKRARREAEQNKVAFNPKMVLLKPVVDFDAVFVPDDFRTVRHFAKLFEYHMVKKLVMIGNHEWRSPALVEPFDKFLEGSFFADFIGTYDKIPATVSAPTLGSPYFVHPQNVVQVDFQLIGYRIARTARMALQSAPPSRRAINDTLAALTSDRPGFFGTGKIFDAHRQSQWPTYLFNVSKGQIALDLAH